MLFKDPTSASAQKTKEGGGDEVTHLREMVKKLQAKYNQTATELQDLTRESNDQKQELLYVIN